MRKVYAGPTHATTGEKIFPGLERGSELGWSPVPVSYAVDYFKHVVFKNPSWDPATLNFGPDVAEAYPAAHQIFDANDPRLSAFTGRGGKLLMYQGWAEPGIPPGHIVNYYAQVQAHTLDAATSVRLFMVPGMGHCGGGDGASTFDMVTALDALGRERHGAGTDSGVARAQRQGRSHAAAVRLSALRALLGIGERRRRGELQLRHAVDVGAGLSRPGRWGPALAGPEAKAAPTAGARAAT